MPSVDGDIVAGQVVLSLKDATALRAWVYDEVTCQQTHDALLTGHIEKLENRLEALGGKKGK